MGLFFIPKLSKKYFYFLAFSISAFLRDFISYINIKDDYKNKAKDFPIQKRYFDIISNILSDSLQGIFVLLNKIKATKVSDKSIENKDSPFNSNDEINVAQKNNSNYSSFFKIMLKICLVDYFCQLIFLLFSLIFNKDEVIERKNNNYLLPVDILSRFIFCRIILDTYFYKHHIVSMIINFVIFFILGTFDIFNIFNIFYDRKEEENQKSKLEIFIYFLFLIAQTIAYSLEDVLNKIALSRESLTPYSLLFYKAVFQIPLVIITSIIVLPIHNSFSDFSSFDTGYKTYELLRRALFIILNILRSIFLVQVIDKFSSQHLSILKVMESILMFGYFLISNKYEKDHKDFYIPVISISFIITVFTSLIYNEILVINLCGMQDYTQHGFDIQAEKDLREAVTEMSGDESNDLGTETSDCRSESLVAQNVSYTD